MRIGVFTVGQQVWLRTKQFSRKQSYKLRPKYTGQYTLQEAARNHTYVIKQHSRHSREAGSRLKVYHLSEHSVRQIPTLVEINSWREGL